MIHKAVPISEPFDLTNLVTVGSGQIVSFPICEQKAFSFILFALDREESITTEYSLVDKWLFVMEGQLEVCIGQDCYFVNNKESIVVPPNAAYELRAVTPVKLLQANVANTKQDIKPIREDKKMTKPLINKIPHAEPLRLADQIEIMPNQTSSKSIVQRSDLSMTLFALDKDSVIAKHSTPGDAMVQVLEGIVEITIGDELYTVSSGESIVMPANIPHALKAIEGFKMLLTVVKHPPQG